MSFNLSGYSEIRSSEHRQVISAKPDTSPYYVYPYVQSTKEDISNNTHRVRVSLVWDKETLSDFANNDEEPFLPFLKGLERQVSVHGQGKIAPEIKLALQQLIECPYSGKTRAIFQEGKAMEIFAHKIEEFRAERCKGMPRQPHISASDIERLHYAAELLIRDLINPPDLTELAGQIGMSRSKFYSHFKMVFEHSPMDHLRKHRLQIARQLLRRGGQTITEIAFAVGFSSSNYFTRAFNAEFGISPSQIK